MKRQREIRHGCEICGGPHRRWTYNAKGIFKLHACYLCYEQAKQNDWEDIARKLAEKAYDKFDMWWEKMYERGRLEREWVQNIRKLKGVIDPIVKCSECKESKSVFEFDENREPWICYRCIAIKENTRICLRCGQRKEKPQFVDDEYEYTICGDCRQQRMKEKVDRIENYLNHATPQQCVAFLERREMAITQENIDMVEQFLIAKRLKKILSEEWRRKQYESDYANVYGKQRPDEANNEREYQTGYDSIGTAGV